MLATFAIAALWFGLALVATFLASRLRVSNALMEIGVGIAAGAVATHFIGPDAFGAKLPWVSFVAGTGAVLLTFLAGAELDPRTLRTLSKEVLLVGLVSFGVPFLGCTALAYFVLGWSGPASWLAGIVLSETSVAVVYAVTLETGLNRVRLGKAMLGVCFVTDLGTLLALGLMFSPFTWKTAVFVAGSTAALLILPRLTPHLVDRYANRTAAFRTKWVLFVLFGLGALALWADTEPVLPAYVAGMLLSQSLSGDHQFIRRLRTLTIGFLSPFYFLRAGAMVSLPALVAAPLGFGALLVGKVATKVLGIGVMSRRFHPPGRERRYYTLLLSTGLTFGVIAALFGLTHGLVDAEQYSVLVAVVIASAVVPTLIAGAFYLPRHLLPQAAADVPPGPPNGHPRPPNAAEPPGPLEEG